MSLFFCVIANTVQRLILRVVEIEGIISQAIKAIRSVLANHEPEIYRHVLDGLSTRKIAGEMNLAEQGVRLYSHTQHLQDIRRQQRAVADLLTGKKVCPVANVLRLFRIVMDRHQLSNGKPPLIKYSLVENAIPTEIQ